MFQNLRLRLIDDWRNGWKFSSNRLIAVGIAVQVSLLAFPDKLLQYVPPSVLAALTVFALACAILGRLTTMEPRHDGNNNQ